MAPLRLLLVAAVAGAANAFAPSNLAVRQSTHLHESFGLGIGEDTYENQPDLLKGEAEYKQYVNRINEDNMLNRKVRHYCDESFGSFTKISMRLTLFPRINSTMSFVVFVN